MKIQKRLFLSYILLSILPLILLVIIFLGQYIKDMLKEQEAYTTNLTDSILERIDGMVEEVDRMLNIVYNIADFEEHLTEAAGILEGSPDYAYNFLQEDLRLKDDLSYLVYDKNVIEDIILIDNAGKNHYIGSNMFEYQKDFRSYDFYEDIIAANGRCHIFFEGCEEIFKNQERDYFAIAKVIKSREDIENIGVIIVTIRLENLEQMFDGYMEEDGERCMIFAEEEVLVDSCPALGDFQKAWTLHSVQTTEKLNGEDYWIYGKASASTEIKILWMSPYRLLWKNAYSIIFYMILIAIVLIISCFAVSFWIATAISKPIVRLDSMARDMAKGELGDTVPETEENIGADEVGQMYHSFLKMKKQITGLLLKEKKSRTEFLANQINPHFLYNTLDSAYMSAIANDDMDTAEIVGQINILLKMIVREQSMVTLKKELEIVESYVAIQKMRYPGKFHYQVFMDKGLEEKIVPKMILQPIVENAITHGVLELDGPGYIYIVITCAEDVLTLRVINGPGRKKEEEIERLNQLINDNDVYGVAHIGLKNIHERLMLNYPKGMSMIARNCTEYDGIEVELVLDFIESESGENYEKKNQNTDCGR